MAPRSVYTGRANENTLTTISVQGQLFLVYASGKDVIIRSKELQHAWTVTHRTITSQIKLLLPSDTGHILVHFGAQAVIFEPIPSIEKEGLINWEYSSQFSTIELDPDNLPITGGWLNNRHVVLGAGNNISAWEYNEGLWSIKWTRSLGMPISKIRVMQKSAIAVVLTENSRIAKVIQIKEEPGYIRVQYIAHRSAIIDAFWQTDPSSSRIPNGTLSLYTITRPGLLSIWSLPNPQSLSIDTANFGPILTATIDLTNTGNTLATSPLPRKQLVAAYILTRGVRDNDHPSSAASENISNLKDFDLPSIAPTQHTNNDADENAEASDNVVLDTPNGSNNTTNSSSTESSPLPVLIQATHSAENCGYTGTQYMGPTRGAFLRHELMTLHKSPGYRKSRRQMRSNIQIIDITGTDSQKCELLYAYYEDGALAIWKIHKLENPLCVPNIEIMPIAPSNILSSISHLLPLTHAKSSFNTNLLRSLMWQYDDDSVHLAVADTVGHVLLFGIAAASTTHGANIPPTLDLVNIWDGHREPVYHISVDPYGTRIATHSIEGELLIWCRISSISTSLSVSRRVALDGSSIRTIAWAPVDSEFIGATRKRVYRLTYNEVTQQWSPSNTTFPNMGSFDHIFTFPCNAPGSNHSSNSKSDAEGYYVSTIEKSTKIIRTWHVSSFNEQAHTVNVSVLSQAKHFNRASRVMPVPHPFFSHDNIMATLDTTSGHMRIWGVRIDPKFTWFCSKKHRLPTMDAVMIRYNSIDKAAIVSVNDDGCQVVTIWVFSSASRASHYLPGGTIYPRNKTDKVREIRWHLTSYAQSYLGIQWDDRIDIYCQRRNLDDAWECIYTIPSSDFGENKTIGSFSFTVSGEPTFSVEQQLVVYPDRLSGEKTIGDIAFEKHGELPYIHPFVLTELMSWGQMVAVRHLLVLLYDYMREREIDLSRDVELPIISLSELISSDKSVQGDNQGSDNKANASSRYSALFGLDENDVSFTQVDSDKFDENKAGFLIEKLTEIKIKGISSLDQARLMSIITTISLSLTKNQPIDSNGVRYLTKLQLLELENKRTQISNDLTYRELNWALHSDSQAILLQLCLQQYTSSGLTWCDARRMGIFLWMTDINMVHSEVEKMARNIFVVEGRDPTKCAIFYLALKKQRLLLGLWRTAHTHPEKNKMVTFLSHDFSESRWRTAAAKNAFVLLSRQRYLDAATFFMLSGKLADAASVCVNQLKDIQLAITICRCYEGDCGPILHDLLWKHILPNAFSQHNRWLISLSFGLVHKYDLVLQALTDSLPSLAKQTSIEMDSQAHMPMDVLDTEFLILYRDVLKLSPSYRAPLVTQAELIAQTITIFECLGVPAMSLVVLEWWRRELYETTKSSTASKLTQKIAMNGTNSTSIPKSAGINTGQLDMSAFGIFSGFETSAPDTNESKPSTNPLESGVLSMDSFGSSFAIHTSSSSKSATDTNITKNDPDVLYDANAQNRSGHDDDADLTPITEIEDTPIQYTCRVALALQIFEYIIKIKQGDNSNIDVDAEMETIADTLRLPLSIFPQSIHRH